MNKIQRIATTLFILVLSLVLIAAHFYQFMKREEPCPLCLLQRLAMIGIAIALLMNLRIGIRVEYYGLAILSSLFGAMASLRQIALHACPGSTTFGEPLLGYHLYVWTLLVFLCSLFACAVLLILYGYSKHREYNPAWHFSEKCAFSLLVLIISANVVTTFLQCGLTPCN